ncbi:RNase A-like domain-containing protein [Jatrophihabitans sp. YIM 134969]
MSAPVLDLDSDVFVTAGRTFLAANDTVCDVVASAATSAGAGGGMAGSDASATAWATVYDQGARQALEAGAVLADRLGEYGILLVTSGQNHEGAEQASVPGAPVYSGTPAVPSAGSVIPAAPPPAAGGSSSPPLVWTVLSALIPFDWPGGDPGRLREVGAGWATAAGSLQDAADRLSAPIGDLSAQQSPEVATAVARCTEIQLAVRSLATAFEQLGTACATLAGHLEQAHAQLTDLVSDVGDLACSGYGVLAAAITGDDLKDKIEKLVNSLKDVFDTLTELISEAAGRLLNVLCQIRALIKQLQALVTTLAKAAFSLAAASVAALSEDDVPNVDLTAMELAGGHTIERHVGKSDEYLENRTTRFASTFPDLATAELATGDNLADNAKLIQDWLAGRLPDDPETLEITTPLPAGVTGRVYNRVTATYEPPSGVFSLLRRTPTGFIVVTSFLEP